jgi:hypothetical protein
MSSCRRSHSLAESHSRLVVAGEMPSTSATSSMVRPPKKAQLDDLRLFGIEYGESIQGFVERHQIDFAFFEEAHGFVQRYSWSQIP